MMSVYYGKRGLYCKHFQRADAAFTHVSEDKRNDAPFEQIFYISHQSYLFQP